MTGDLRGLDSFGEVSAEDDTILLDYFLTTDTVREIEQDKKFMVLGRKGVGKTAIVRHFSEGAYESTSLALNLRNYPWKLHEGIVDRSTDPVDAYTASWRYLIAVKAAAWVIENKKNFHLDQVEMLRKFLNENYGNNNPKLDEILRPKKLKLAGLSISPNVLGNSLGGVSLERHGNDLNLGVELEALTSAILYAAVYAKRSFNLPRLFLHFDELDAGMQLLDMSREAMLIGLTLAARQMRRRFQDMQADISVVVYLRTDIWDNLNFSDKNKITQGQALSIEWEPDSLQELVESRLKAKLGSGVNWDAVTDSNLMRGSQPKWNHIVARSFKRPRDIIQFLNCALVVAKKRKKDVPLRFINKDIVDSRKTYSSYLKSELDDEVKPHWPKWEEAHQALSAIGIETFDREEFVTHYRGKRSGDNPYDADEALRLLYRFSVIGYRSGVGYGGSTWNFHYNDANVGWDANATKLKAHPGLKEYLKLRERREPGIIWDD